MSNPFFDAPILNSPYERPARHWELDDDGQPTQKVLDKRRPAAYVTPIPRPRKRKPRGQAELELGAEWRVRASPALRDSLQALDGVIDAELVFG